MGSSSFRRGINAAASRCSMSESRTFRPIANTAFFQVKMIDRGRRQWTIFEFRIDSNLYLVAVSREPPAPGPGSSFCRKARDCEWATFPVVLLREPGPATGTQSESARLRRLCGRPKRRAPTRPESSLACCAGPGRARLGAGLGSQRQSGRGLAAAGQRAGRRQYLSSRGVEKIEKHLPC